MCFVAIHAELGRLIPGSSGLAELILYLKPFGDRGIVYTTISPVTSTVSLYACGVVVEPSFDDLLAVLNSLST